ncbi:ECF RNA polymerase sigma factor SigK [Nocardioides daphniae]|uniref:RNA polymerase sigma factor n=1 Tax=Nocardioides daphniae TaxID=402297 RepID=A0A4P7UA70_9ACTN|nr:ECF RNA polymerase sigma factor SigK [Nocardioides daphniae]QCC76195.1 sigma-70 family RNA polymerase sigma factor [Nocardioides daphniae]GGD09086.1 RNA polymerase sigma factor SigK [Nocardioides daphniae]
MDHLRPLPSEGPEPGSSGGSASPDVAALLRASAQGDQQAFAQFYDATCAQAYGLAVRVLRNPSHAQEVTQEAYLLVWRQSARFDPTRGSALAWLMTIVHRAAVDRVRASESAVRREQVWEQVARPLDHDQTAEAAQAALEGHRVRRAVAELTPAQRQAVELAYFGGYTHTEVASMLEVPLGTAKTRIRDGLIRLRDALGVAR